MMKLKIEFAKNKCLSTIWSTEKIPVTWTYPAREHYKKTPIFCDFYNLTPTWFMANFLVHIFDAWLRTICNAAVRDTPFQRY